MTISIIVLVLISKSHIFTSLIISQLVQSTWPLPIQRAGAVERDKTSLLFPDQNPSSISTDKAIGTSVSKNVHTSCIKYIPSKRTITVSRTTPTRLTDVDNALHDNSILAKQTSDGVWLLSANLVIDKGAIFHIDSTDAKWLKINSRVVGGSIPAYSIAIHGSLNID